MTKVVCTSMYLHRSLLEKLKIQLCAATLCAAGTAVGPATASTLNTIYIDTTDTYGYLSLGYPVAVAGGRVIDVVTSANPPAGPGDGTLFELTPGKAGTQYTRTNLHTFLQSTASTDGEGPLFDLIRDKDGNIWGTTGAGGTYGTGTLFKLTKPTKATGEWVYQVVLSLPAALPAGNQQSALVFDSAGNLFGMNSTGSYGASCAPAGCGVIWEVTAARLAGGNDPVQILAAIPAVNYTDSVQGLATDVHGNLFTISVEGGTGNGRQGEVWEVSPPATSGGTWSVQVIHSFCSILDTYNACVDGANPIGGVVVKDGVLYGATQYGGGGYLYANLLAGGNLTGGGNGIIYSLTRPAKSGGSWTFNVVYELTDINPNGTIGAAYDVHSPNGPPVFSSTGALVLPTYTGGAVDVTGANPNFGGTPINGGVISVDPAGGGFSIVSNAFGIYNPPYQSGPIWPYGPLSRNAKGDYYGASGYWNNVTQSQIGGNTIYQVIP
jgi:uncharacterized repeat protein (TIGR03803 family)